MGSNFDPVDTQTKLGEENNIHETNTSDKSYVKPSDDIPSTSAAAVKLADGGDEFSPELLQRKLYFLLDQLKGMHAQLSEEFQIRISYDLLAQLANSLLNDTVYEIVKGLTEIQHVTEKHLKQLRDEVVNEFQIEVEDWKSKITDPEELQHLLSLMQIKHARKLKETDMKIIEQLDQKVKDQQKTLFDAGVAGFYVTDNPKEIIIQMYLLDFILRLSRIKFDPNK